MRNHENALNGVRTATTIGFAVAAGLLVSLGPFQNRSAGGPASRLETIAKKAGETPPARRYDGLTLEQWRIRIKSINLDDPAAGRETPGLLAIVADEDAPWFSRRQAALTLGRIGPPAAAAVPLLRRLALTRREEDARPLDEENTPLWAIKALARFGPVAAEAAPDLIDILNDASRPDAVRLVAVEALGRIGLAHPQALLALIETLRFEGQQAGGPDEAAAAFERRVAAAEVLSLSRGGAAPAVPALMRAAADDSERLRHAAAATLGAIGPAADPALLVLADLVIFDESAHVRDRAAIALAEIGPASIPALQMLLRDEDPEVRWRAADALRRLGPPALPAIDDLRQAAADSSPTVRISALEAVWAVAEDAALVPAVVSELAGEDRSVRVRASDILVQMGAAASSAIPELERLTQDERPYVRQAARRTLAKLTGERGM